MWVMLMLPRFCPVLTSRVYRIDTNESTSTGVPLGHWNTSASTVSSVGSDDASAVMFALDPFRYCHPSNVESTLM